MALSNLTDAQKTAVEHIRDAVSRGQLQVLAPPASFRRLYSYCTAKPAPDAGCPMCEAEERAERAVKVQYLRTGRTLSFVPQKHKTVHLYDDEDYELGRATSYLRPAADGTLYAFWQDAEGGHWDTVAPGETKTIGGRFEVQYRGKLAAASYSAVGPQSPAPNGMPVKVTAPTQAAGGVTYVKVTERSAAGVATIHLQCDTSDEKRWARFVVPNPGKPPTLVLVGRGPCGTCEIRMDYAGKVKYVQIGAGQHYSIGNDFSVTNVGTKPLNGIPSSMYGQRMVQQSLMAPPPQGPVKDLCDSIQYELDDPKCECGAAKCGVGRGMAGHSSWCPWRQK